MFSLLVVLPTVLVRDCFDYPINQIVEDGGEIKNFRRIDLLIMDVIEFGDIHAGNHFARDVILVHALLHPFLDIDLDLLVNKIGASLFVLFKDFRECLCQLVADGGRYIKKSLVNLVPY